MKGQVFWMVDPEADAITSPFVRQPHYADLEARIRKLETVISKLVPENERENVGLSVGSLRALQSMVASQADAATEQKHPFKTCVHGHNWNTDRCPHCDAAKPA